ncbi:MAG: TonB-dependent receptor [Ignavibacteriales bacterium]|nr:TonB-dependent receptor [Ignavibacteriales bacterium]
MKTRIMLHQIKKNFVLLVIILCTTNLIFAQKGKISGKILDDRTSETLISANIVLEGTNLGATSDVDGRYTILNISPGKYSVTASMIGYGKLTKSQVEVFIDRTTDVSFRLKDVSIQFQQVTIVAEKPKIIKDQTSTANTMDDEQIKAAPIEGLRGALDLSSSFQKDDKGNYSVRGSGSYEINFQVNGISQSQSITSAPAGGAGVDKADNSYKYDVNPLAVQQVQVISGGFSAEYGNAQAGIVKVALKEGTPKFSGEVRFEYRPEGQYHFGNYLYDPSTNFEWKTWGQLNYWTDRMYNNVGSPLYDLNRNLFEKIKSGKGTSADTALANRTMEWAHNLWLNNHTPSEENQLGVYDYRQHSYKRFMFGFGGPLGKNPDLLKFYFAGEYRNKPTRLPTPERDQVYQYYTLTLTYQPFTAHKFKFMGALQKYRGGLWSGSDDIRWAGIPFVPGGSSSKYRVTTDPVRSEQTITQSLSWIYTISTSSFLETIINNQQERFEIPYVTAPSYDLEADRADSLTDPRGFVLPRGLWYDSEYTQPFSFSSIYYQDSRNNHWGATIDYTNQITNSNLLKAGFKFYYWDLMNNAVNSSFQANTYVTRSGFAEFYRAYPYNVAAYIQDKMEYEGMIANVGVRVETYNFQQGVSYDQFDPFYPGTGAEPFVGVPTTTSSESKYIVLPRIGISFPIGENTAFRIQYGHFASMPSFAQAYSQRTNAGWNNIGNPNLDYKKTIQYEFGLQQVLDDRNRIDISIYYNDRVTQIGTQRIAAITGNHNTTNVGYLPDNTPLYPYTSFANNGFGSTVGIEIIFEKVGVGNWGYRLSYNISQTTDGNFGASIVYPGGLRYERRDFTGEYVSYNDRTHNFRGYLQYQFKEEDGPEIFGINLLSNSLFGLTYTAQSGTPFTYITEFNQKSQLAIRNNRRYPLESNFDFNFQKTFKSYGMNLILGIRVMNLFNNKILTPMDTEDDLNNWINDTITMDDPADKPDRKSYRIASFKTYKNIPRQIFFSLGVGF